MENSKEDIARGEAARIRARLDAPDCSPVERVQADRWLNADPINERAFQEVHAVSVRLARAALDARFQNMAERAFAAGASLMDDGAHRTSPRRLVKCAPRIASQAVSSPGVVPRKSRRYGIPASLAASALLAACAMWLGMHDTSSDTPASTASRDILAADDKTPRQFTLADGSIVHVDAGAKLAVSLTAGERRIELLAGRAFFEVAHDRQRPFIVLANGTQTLALGTQFEVRLDDQRTEVTLLEGSVAVSGQTAAKSGTGVSDYTKWTERLAPGQQLHIESDVLPARYDVDAGNVISWSRGWLVFRGTPLAEAIGQINRYSSKQVTLADTSLSDLTIAGSFIAGDSESIVSAIAEVLPIRVVDGGNREVLLFRRYDR